MYGIVNQAIQGLVIENFGEEKWKDIKQKAHIQLDYFLSDSSYDDEITFNLVGAASEVLNIPASDILKAFGEYWVLKTGKEKYGDLMKAGGSNFKEFVQNLPNFHSRIMLIYPKLSPPEFFVEEKDNKLILHYYSTRDGLTDFVVGLLHGLAKMFDTEMSLEHILTEKNESWHDVFEIEVK
jgi:hypothetical protein